MQTKIEKITRIQYRGGTIEMYKVFFLVYNTHFLESYSELLPSPWQQPFSMDTNGKTHPISLKPHGRTWQLSGKEGYHE
ncbi:MAG: hypothetical protein HXS54_13035 [Theionarchaea archaeon]|nr:hypothetical protein [Theionarchaea archaeon]